ncbi:MAG: prohibitin family protein [Anaerolineales bacterium]|jgi:regulator of protease activity HflC (stomatin/prohibitin superfamily)
MNIIIAMKAIAGISWLAVVGLLVVTVLRASRRQNIRALVTALILTLVVAVLINTASAGLVFVQPEQRGVVISALAPKGYREAPLQPGLRWVIPYAENVELYPISKQNYTMSIAPLEGQIQGDDSVTARTSDGQEIFVDASVIYSVDPERVINVHIAWQKRYPNELVRPLARGVIRDAVSQFQVDQVVSTKRFELSGLIDEAMSNALEENGLLLSNFVLRNITFSPEYANSVEQKQIAEQQAQQAAYVVQQREQEAEQARKVAQGQADATVINAEGGAKAVVIQANADAEARLIRAEAEAEALDFISAVIEKNPDLLKYRYIEEIAPGIQVMLLPSDNPFLLPLPELEQNPGLNTPVPSPTPLPTPPPTEEPAEGSESP